MQEESFICSSCSGYIGEYNVVAADSVPCDVSLLPSFRTVDIAEASQLPRVYSSRRLLQRTYNLGCAYQVRSRYPNGCRSGQSCYDGNRCRAAADCCSYRCLKGRCCGSYGGMNCENGNWNSGGNGNNGNGRNAQVNGRGR
ncbi:hypothetical protein KC19_2G124700 [Ceratodon purpureus]|uniref:Uncharacterized protein n=1 Tax=Ceratodon purpureus TaxID=3225 RepID=A0A8T0IUR7_CERPU|nr:hypothetical protein KC19_2G124700 [Ceratodon purpureus]